MNGPARVASAAGAGAWVGALAGWHLYGPGIVAAALAAAIGISATRRTPARRSTIVVGCVIVAAATSGMLAAARRDATLEAELPAGRADVIGVVADQPVVVGSDLIAVLGRPIRDDGLALPPTAVVWPPDVGVRPEPGDTIAATGRLVNRPGLVRGDPVAGRLEARHITVVRTASGPMHRVAAAARARVQSVLGGGDAATALLAGFLIGDTSGLDREQVDSLRSAGLSHFVAVSGSNVALFLGAWWVLLTPLSGPRVRAVVGMVGLVLFTLITRWEPSVLRAVAMIALVLAGRLAGIPIEPVVALGWGMVVLILVAGDLAATVGFQLSVAATAGVMLGIKLAGSRRPRWVWSILGATAGAQAAVAPLLLIHFGSVPLMAPLANLVAAPLVTAATTLGGLAVLAGGGPVLGPASLAANGVLVVADVAAGWPQLDLPAVVAVIAVGALAMIRRWRRLAIVALSFGMAMASLPAAPPSGASITVMDVGQGDAIVVRDGSTVMLIDGGRDPRVLAEALDRNRVGHVDVLVATHGDADHAGGLVGLSKRVPVGSVWVPRFGDHGDLISSVVADARAGGVPVERIASGAATTIGRIRITALGPQRRYKSDNDGAIVLWVESGGTAALLPSDVERVAQSELPSLRPDVLVVPHHGAATTDSDWLAETTGRIAVVSVGENLYGHPSEEVMDVLAASGTTVFTTEATGDVVIPLPAP
jgi:competence protein ComEC